jgi:response regulator RpfG family c-di-GMP phosphodiesterase
MQNYSKIIAKSLAGMKAYKEMIDFRYINDIYRFSPVHDVGKVGIADGILLKPGKLSHEEFEVMKMHTTIGAGILTKSNYGIHKKERHLFDMGIEIALAHHERYNGSGYPNGLSGENIPLSARIVIIADVLDALTSKRVYKNAFDINTSLDFIKDESGKMFDPDIVCALLEIKDGILTCYEQFNEVVDLSNI